MCHLKLEMLLESTGYKTPEKERKRFNVFLTNSLEPEHEYAGLTLLENWISKESNEADAVKKDSPVMVVIGNPPYAGESSNKGKWIEHLLDDYKQEPTGGKLKEKNSKWINDDYVKFLKYSQNLIEKNDEGILAFINPHGFLDNPTFRGMRFNLLKTYDKIFVVDLHGNAKKKETCPDGSPDNNVFDIQQGVCINIFIKKKRKNNNLAQVFHYDLFGKRKVKYDYLNENNLSSVSFKKLEPQLPYYFFVKKDYKAQAEYDKCFLITELLSINSVGVGTYRDSLVIDNNKQKLQSRIYDFFNEETEFIKEKLDIKENNKWTINNVKKTSKLFDDKYIKSINYRPFDIPYVYFDSNFIERPRSKVMQNFVGDNLGLIIGRQGQAVGSMPWNLSFITKEITDLNIFYRGGGSVFPLYLYNNTEDNLIDGQAERRPNLDKEIVGKLSEKLELEFTPEKESSENTFAPIDILDYIYGVLHSPNYREKYKEFLKIDFPRIPYPTDQTFFKNFAKKGEELRQLHLMDGISYSNLITRFPIEGNAEVIKPEFKQEEKTNETGKVFINKEQYFAEVPKVAWEFYIGGYQPAQKWLKDRKGRELSNEEIIHYQKIIYILSSTKKIMEGIDNLHKF